MKLFMKDAKVKMSENLSSWALQSGGDRVRYQEPRVDRPTSCPSWPSCQRALGQPLPSWTACLVESSPSGKLKRDCP